MAGFYLIASDSPDERRSRAERAGSRLSPVACGFRTIEHAGATLLVAHLAHTPLSFHHSDDGSLTAVIGAPVSHERILTAADIAGHSGGVLPLLSGLFVCIHIRADGTISVQGDPFSTFPIYHHADGSVAEISSTQNAIRCQPGFSGQTDMTGLARLLLNHGSSGARTLTENIRRLTNDSRLTVSPSREIRLHRLPFIGPSGKPLPRNPKDAPDETNSMVADAIRRHIPLNGGRPDFLFSGGLDSRLLLAHLLATGVRPRCITRGLPSDNEVMLARTVAEKSGCPWSFVPDDPALALAAAETEARLCSLQGGFSSVSFAINPTHGFEAASHTFNGFFLDSCLHPFRGLKDPGQPSTFEGDFDRKMNLLGIRPDLLETLLLPRHRDAVREAIEEMRAEWAALPEDPPLRYRHVVLRFRANHHVGSILWKTSFNSWPVSIALDVPFINRLMDYPAEWFAERRLEREMLVRLSPALAKIPFDRNSAPPKPIIETFGYKMSRKLGKLRSKWFPRPAAAEVRRYHRILDINGTPWAPVRAETDGLRHHFDSIFDPDALRNYFPTSGRPVPLAKDSINEHGGHRMLAGLALHLATEP